MSTDNEKISSLYHEAETPGPSKSLDDAILAASRDAVDRPTATKGPFSASWPAAASIAAVIVITIILVPILKQQEPQQGLTQTAREKSRSPALPDATGPNTYRSSDVKKKSMDAPSTASEPAMLPEDRDITEYQSMPARSGVSSPAPTAPASASASSLEKEEMQPESDTSHAERSILQAADSAPFAILTPEMWQTKISRLITEGKIEDARDETEKLKKHHPEYIIDPTLLEKLK
jgi:hypothetical protein